MSGEVVAAGEGDDSWPKVCFYKRIYILPTNYFIFLGFNNDILTKDIDTNGN